MEKVIEIVRIKQEINELEWDNRFTVRSPGDGAEIASKIIGEDDREVLLVMCLNTKNQVIAVHRAHVGALDSSICHPREVFKAAILNNSRSIMVAHQHPSQDTTPSREDYQVTDRLKKAGEILGIELLDHLVVNAFGQYTSIREQRGL